MTNVVVKVLLMGMLASIFGRAIASEPQSGLLVSEEGFVDVDLPISEHRFAKDGTLTVIARGKINDQVVAFAVDVGHAWKEQLVEDAELTIYWGTGHIRSIGQESDAFLTLLANEYGTLTPSSTMAPRSAITMAGLNSNPANLRSEPAKMKVFFEDGGEASYGEVFINIDLDNKVLGFHDKDPEYHQGILSSLGGGT